MKRFVDVVGLIASLLGIFNVFLALPSVFKDLDSNFLVEITNKNFALRLGFILILQFAIGYLLSNSIAIGSRSRKSSNIFSIGLLAILITCWLTFFNISEILYIQKLTTVKQHFGMLFFVILAILIQGFQILYTEWQKSYYNSWYSTSADEYKRIQDEKEFTEGKVFFIAVLAIFQIILFAVYWLN